MPLTANGSQTPVEDDPMRSRSFSLISWFLLILICGWVDRAESAPTIQGPRIAPGPVVVRVQSASTPIQGALVSLGGRFVGSDSDGLATFDGVPAGDYPLVVSHPGFDRVERRESLPAGRRARTEVELVPTTWLDVRGTVLLGAGARPVPGARISLEPKNVPASMVGNFELTADWEGNFVALQVPAGQYMASVAFPGCEAWQQSVDFAAGQEDLQWRLTPETEPGQLTVSVVDSVSGSPVPGAQLVLAGAWPMAEIASMESDAEGKVDFENLGLGRLNWEEDGVLPRSRNRATLHVEAEGYEPAVHLVSLRGGGRKSILLNPATELAEQEPNGGIAGAQAVRTGAPIRFRISENGDRDVFSIRLKEQAMVGIELGPETPIQTHIQLMDSTGKVIKAQGAHVGKANSIRLGLFPGLYYIQISEWGDNGASEQDIILTIVREVASDTFEPNDSAANARLIKPGECVRGTILPYASSDHYRFELDQPGTARFFIPIHKLQREVVVRDETGKVIKSQGVHANQNLDLRVPLQAGRFQAQVREWGNDKESVEPYAMQFDFVPNDGVHDRVTPGRLVPQRYLEPGALVGATINPVKDSDLYGIALESAGLLRLKGLASSQLEIRVLDPNGKVLISKGAHAGNQFTVLWSAPGPLLALVEVREWGHDSWSPWSYTLRAEWDPSDEMEALGRNETMGEATPVEPGEVLRGSLSPYRDQDVYRLDLDHPGYLYVEGRGPTQIEVTLLDAQGKRLANRGVHANKVLKIGADLPAGPAFIHVREWGNDGQALGSYALTTNVARAEAIEGGDLKNEFPRRLRVGEAQSFNIDQVKDRDRFLCDVPAAGKVHLRFVSPGQAELTAYDDRTGKKLFTAGQHANKPGHRTVEAKGPMRLRLEVAEWGNDSRTNASGYLQVRMDDLPLVVDTVQIQIDPTDPTLVHFARNPWKATESPSQVGVDLNGDGASDVEVRAAGGGSIRLAGEGIYPARVISQGANGQTTVENKWIHAVGPRERKGVLIRVQYPRQDQVIETAEACKVHAISYTGTRVARIQLHVDGVATAAAYSQPFELQVPWRELAAGPHELTFTAEDARGNRSSVTRNVTLSEYFELSPSDGAHMTGDDVQVSWTGPQFGPAAAEFRKLGDEAWTRVEGRHARMRRVALTGLEPGSAYEWRAIGSGEAGPTRQVTLIEGLAFGRASYGANIARDYDQRLAISVRNHTEIPQIVELQCGQPASELLLVGFVGDGSEGAPFELGPGEEREFLLGLSAQDVVLEKHQFPVRLVSAGVQVDEALVDLVVRLPEVKFEWTDLGVAENGLGHRFRVRNVGDSLTDFWVGGSSEDVLVSPAIEHGIFQAGATEEIVVRPRLHEGFESMEGQVMAGALAESTPQDVAVALEPGQSLHSVALNPGSPGETETEKAGAALLQARALSGYYLDPSYVDWSVRQNPEDTNGDGRADRWSQKDEMEGVLWIGNDTTGDGAVDFVQGDVWWDGQVDYSAFKTEQGWEQTNLVETWVEMDFSLPWARNSYEKHDLELVINDKVVGGFTSHVPEGNYSFKLPASAIDFTDNGTPGANSIELRTKHLRGGHYVVSSDFEFKTRTTGGNVWSAATSQEEAKKQVMAMDGLVLDKPDFSVSSGRMVMEGPENPAVGDELTIRVPMRNLGAIGSEEVPVALMRSDPGGNPVELARQMVSGIPLVGEKSIAFPWTAGAGNHSLQVVIDPDRGLGEQSMGNNTAMMNLQVAGDDQQPTLALEGLEAGAVLGDSVFGLQAIASDDSGIARLEAAVDEGLWRTVANEDGRANIKGLLQPGDHNLRVRATDSSGNQVSQQLPVTVDVQAPAMTILEPEEGASLDLGQSPVRMQVGPDVAKAMVRVDGGPWIEAPITDGVAEARVPVGYGPGEIEAQAINDRGVRTTAKRKVQGTWQPSGADDGFRPDYVDDSYMDIDGLGPIDLIEDPDFIFDDDDDLNVDPPQEGEPREPGEGEAIPTPDEPIDGVDPALLSPGGPPPRYAGWGPDGGPQFGPSPVHPAGGMVVSRHKQKSWYCTNKPKIKVPFRLPDWLMRKNLPPPGTKQYAEMVQKLLEQLRAQGIDTAALERFQKSLERSAGQMEGTREVPGWLESVGFGSGTEVNETEREIRREQMLERTQAWWLRLLASGDPALIAQGLRARGNAFRKFDEGLQTESQAAIDSVLAHQTLVEDLAEGLPMVGESMDMYAIITGKRVLNGQEISDLERVIRAGGLVAPFALEQLFKRSRLAQKGAVYATEKLSVAGKWGKKTLSELSGIPPGKVDDFLKRVQDVLTTEISYNRWKTGRAADKARKVFLNSADGIADMARHADEMDEARRVIKSLGDAADDADFERMVLEGFQTNKTAQRIINTDVATDDLRRRINKSLRSVYDDVDNAAKNRLKSIIGATDDELVDIAAQTGRRAEDLKQFRDRIRKIAKDKKIDPGDLRLSTDDFSANPDTRVGRDRDVTFFVDDVNGNHLTDVHHDLSKNLYEDELWRRTRGTDIPGPGDVARNAEGLDQMVTSKWHPEAYRSGDSTFGEFLNTGRPPTVTRLDDIRDTMNIKSEHWWHMAAKETNLTKKSQQIAEGMRQATKQWDRIIEPRVGRYLGEGSLAAKVKIPTDLQVSLDIFRKVEKGHITTAQASAMLNEIGLTHGQVLHKMTGFFEAVEKDVGRQFRRIGAAKLDQVLKSNPFPPGTVKWGEDALGQINGALKSGAISGDVFMAQRKNVLTQIKKGVKLKADASADAFAAFDSWIHRAMTDRRISRLEARALREWSADEQR